MARIPIKIPKNENDNQAGTLWIDTDRNSPLFYMDGMFKAGNIPEDWVNVKDFGAKGNGVHDDTEAIQNAINTGKNVYFPKGTYLIDLQKNNKIKLNVSNNQIILGHSQYDTTIKVKENSLTLYYIFDLTNKTNVTIEKLHLQGDLPNHIDEGGEWGHCLNLTASKDIILKDLILSHAWGDGISCDSNSTNIIIENLKIHTIRRNAISLMSGENIMFKNIDIYDIGLTSNNGTPPQTGIDIEPNNVPEDYQLNNIIFENININNCQNMGLQIQIYFDTLEYINMIFKNITIKNILNNHGIQFEIQKEPIGNMKFENITIENANYCGILVKHHTNKISTTFNNVQLINNNVSQATNYLGAYLSIRNSDEIPNLGNIKFQNISIINTEETKKPSYYIYAVQDTTTEKYNEIYIHIRKIYTPYGVLQFTPWRSKFQIKTDNPENMLLSASVDGREINSAYPYRYVEASSVSQTITLDGSKLEKGFKTKISIIDNITLTISANFLDGGSSLQSSQKGATVELELFDPSTNKWKIINQYGTWTLT